MFVNKMARYELLSDDAIEILDRGWRRIVSEIGVQFVKPEAVELFRQAGQTVDDQTVRSDATMTDFRKFSMLAQSFPELDSAGGVICELNDAPLDSRHLDMIFALQTLTDKIYMGNVVSGPNALDTIKMTEILLGGRESIEATPPRSR